jgi:hypothetical protein
MLFRLHLTRNLRTLGLLLSVSAVLSIIGVLWWANHIGLPPHWRGNIEKAVAKQGMHLEIGSLRYVLFQGIVATDVKVYSEAGHQTEISRLERITLDFDNTKLARGLVHLKKIQLHKARLILQVDPSNPLSETLHVHDVSGTIITPGGQHLEIRDARGMIAGIQVSLDARLIGFKGEEKKDQQDSNLGKRRELLTKVIRELNQWTFDPHHPPTIQISAGGDLNDWFSIVAKVSLHVGKLGKNGHQLHDIVAEAEIAGNLVTITALKAWDSKGTFEGLVDYNISDREGRFEVTSSLELPRLFQAWLGLPALKDVTISGKQTLRAQGAFHLNEHDHAQLALTGHARCEAVKLRGMPFDSVECAFSWRNGRFFLRDARLARSDGAATGKALIEWPRVRLELHTTLPVPVYRPFFVKQPLEIVLRDFSERKDAAVDVTLAGSFNLTDKHAWSYKGHGAVKNLNYKGVPVNSAACKLSLNHRELDFSEGTVVFNYSDYNLHKTFNGASEGSAKVGRIRYDAPSKLVHVEDVRGGIWAAPMVRFFAAKIADGLEQYRFHQPPELSASGVVDVTPQGRTALDISFRSDQSADYVFLGKNVTLGRPSGKVSIRGEKVTVSDLKVEAFEGPVVGQINYLGAQKLSGELSWTDLSLASVTSTYGFKMKGGGKGTGRIDFSLTDGKVSTMDGNGLLALENAELFSVPMFGPLTPLVSGILADERAGSQRAKNAFFTFKIQNGILSSNDFQTSTTSLNFTGNGSVDMNDRKVDMTMRMNARGLLGFLTLPLRPFAGLFQFRGTGPLEDTRWESVSFSPPADSQKEALLSPPKAKVIRER